MHASTFGIAWQGSALVHAHSRALSALLLACLRARVCMCSDCLNLFCGEGQYFNFTGIDSYAKCTACSPGECHTAKRVCLQHFLAASMRTHCTHTNMHTQTQTDRQTDTHTHTHTHTQALLPVASRTSLCCVCTVAQARTKTARLTRTQRARGVIWAWTSKTSQDTSVSSRNGP